MSFDDSDIRAALSTKGINYSRKLHRHWHDLRPQLDKLKRGGDLPLAQDVPPDEEEIEDPATPSSGGVSNVRFSLHRVAEILNLSLLRVASGKVVLRDCHASQYVSPPNEMLQQCPSNMSADKYP